MKQPKTKEERLKYMLKYIRACDDRRERAINLLANWGRKNVHTNR